MISGHRLAATAGAVIAIGLTVAAPTTAYSGLIGKITKAVVYPVKKAGTNASVNTHRAIQHNSVQNAPNTGGTQKEVVKPSGNKQPIGP